MHLYVVRHGETWANAEQRYLGALDPALTETGRQQARALAGTLPAQLDALVVSPRLRALETASILNQDLQLAPRTMACFRERDVGVFEGLTQAEARERYPQLWSRNITRRWDAGPTAGESIAEVVERVREGLLELEASYPAQRVLLVAHGFVAKVIRALSKGDFADFYDWQLANGNLLALEPWRMPSLDAERLRDSLPVP
ncbi:histidine phosphatase family protein [Pseudomonas sp. zfem002]|uniref:histidine phosphatase family protein n=1 Tax=Pseudomonas sp. zfem002 TaxID=3078197 RepID=UPI0029298698|nr:histidine phosphatase family protein [Pseudomonas sp. zfem002]MDU9393941.1 histidine phosphatase family protein [Pseudomonas sp. zfem002]